MFAFIEKIRKLSSNVVLNPGPAPHLQTVDQDQLASLCGFVSTSLIKQSGLKINVEVGVASEFIQHVKC